MKNQDGTPMSLVEELAHARAAIERGDVEDCPWCLFWGQEDHGYHEATGLAWEAAMQGATSGDVAVFLAAFDRAIAAAAKS